MIRYFAIFVILVGLTSCSNAPELETGEIKILQLLRDALLQSQNKKSFIDSRNLISRSQIDAAAMPVIFVELETGQNGTLTPYPGKGVGKTWLGADGATVTLDRGILKATRGMGDDLMGSYSALPPWTNLDKNLISYPKKSSYLSGNNKIYEKKFKCTIKKNNKIETIEIWSVAFLATRYDEVCTYKGKKINNIYYVDDKRTVRRSRQHHSETLGYITIERLDR